MFQMNKIQLKQIQSFYFLQILEFRVQKFYQDFQISKHIIFKGAYKQNPTQLIYYLKCCRISQSVSQLFNLNYFFSILIKKKYDLNTSINRQEYPNEYQGLLLIADFILYREINSDTYNYLSSLQKLKQYQINLQNSIQNIFIQFVFSLLQIKQILKFYFFENFILNRQFILFLNLNIILDFFYYSKSIQIRNKKYIFKLIF
ncbi:transmembrane protein, putative (macronuclear) [Tetrahymena thermophila SB210]|uniref:Transmembrane protein, putative n=1 Tax=Tetrahymena thermophila (strain SB210) TaxID=312017 RepID=W7XJC6_TETTS|nr:transmembrane protein, putative [Tetrahymena thermophila SB210]EWS74039.1 transmembrane protein, putative [Tetrahymena thermophila SB210]|eukprot:XP_012653438.1 transmembrane protein, putative [Tetrahymena thermophila SB210]